MATFTVRPEGIIRQPAMTMPGNATGSEAACTALNASSIRTLLSLSTVSDVTFDIVRATTSVQTPLVNNASAALTLGNSTYGVTVPGNAVIGDGASANSLTLNTSLYRQILLKSAGVVRGYISADATSSFAVTNSLGSITQLAINGSTSFATFAGGASFAGSGSFDGFSTTSAGVSITGGALQSPCTINTTLYPQIALNYNGVLCGYIEGNTTNCFVVKTTSGGVQPSPLVINNSTRASVFDGDISMSKTSAQGYITAWNQAGTYSSRLYHGTFGAYLETDNSNVNLAPANGIATVYRPGVDGQFLIYGLVSSKNMTLTAATGAIGMTDAWSVGNSTCKINTYLNAGVGPTHDLWIYPSSGLVQVYNASATQCTLNVWSNNGRYATLTHDSTNGILSTNNGNLNLVPAGGTVAVTGGITASGTLNVGRIQNGSGASDPVITLTSSSMRFGYVGNGESRAYLSGGALLLGSNYIVAFSNTSADALGGSLDAGYARNAAGVLEINNGTLISGGGSYGSLKCASVTANGGATITGGGASGTAGAKIGSHSTGIGGLWSSTVTPSTTNYVLAFDGASTFINAPNAAGLVYFNAGGGSIGSLSTTTLSLPSVALSCAGITASGNVSYAQGLSTGTVTKSANYTTTADDYCVNVTANSIDITFETAVGCANREHEVINSGSGVVTLKTTSAQTISGSASGALTLAQWKSIRVKSDGANWLIMSQIT